MHKISIGSTVGGLTSMQEGAIYSYGRSGHHLIVMMPSPTEAEVSAFKAGQGRQFAFAVEKGVIFLLARFGNQPWMDAPYSIHLLPERSRVLPEIANGTTDHALLISELVDSTTGRVVMTNVCTFDPFFTRRLHEAIRAQAGRMWLGRASYDAAIAEVFGILSTRQLVKRARARMIVLPECGGPASPL